MKKIHSFFFWSVIFFAPGVYAQGLVDYYVTINNDTVRNVTFDIRERFVRVWGSDYRHLMPEQVKCIYSVGQFYHPILIRSKGKPKMLRCEKPGEINLYRRVREQSGTMWQDANGFSHYSSGENIETYYLLAKNSKNNFAVKVKRAKDLVYLVPDHKLMDSLYRKELGPDIADLVEKYNKIAARKNSKRE